MEDGLNRIVSQPNLFFHSLNRLCLFAAGLDKPTLSLFGLQAQLEEEETHLWAYIILTTPKASCWLSVGFKKINFKLKTPLSERLEQEFLRI